MTHVRIRTSARFSLTALAAIIGLCVGLSSFCASAAAAGTPAWRINGFSLPTILVPGETGQIQLQVEDIGNASTDGSPVTVVDHLPPGLIATAAGALEKGENSLEIPGPWGECAGIGTSTVTCTYEAGIISPVSYFSPGPVLQGGAEEQLEAGQPPAIGIEVTVDEAASGSATNTAVLSGGGASVAATASIPISFGPTPAHFGVSSFHQWSTNVDGTPDIQAGSHPYETTTSFFLNAKDTIGNLGGEVKDLHVDLPTGFIGNPNATPKCSREAFDTRLDPGGVFNPSCPSDTQVGVVLLRLSPNFTPLVPVYNLVPPPGVPAQLGFAAEAKLGFINANVRTGGSYNAFVDLKNIVQVGFFGASLTLWGNPADPAHDKLRFQVGGGNSIGSEEGSLAFGAQPRPFLTLPTSCGQTQTLFASLDSWAHAIVEPAEQFSLSAVATDMQDNPVPITGCEKLAFEPSISVQPETSSAESPTGLAVDLKIPQNEDPAGLAAVHLKEAVVRLPAGMTVSPSAANGLGACTLEEIGMDNAAKPACPDSSKIGSVRIVTPLLKDPLEGSVFLAQQGNLPGNGSNPFDSLLALYLVAEGSGALVKLTGQVTLDPVSGQLTARFGEDPIRTLTTGEPQFLPQLPFSDLKMSFFGGPRAPLITPSNCGTYTTTSQLIPWNGGPPAEPSSVFSIGAGCASGFTPSFTAGTSNNQAGAFSPFSVTLARQDGEQRLGGVQVTTPPGLLGVLKSVERCPEPQASQGACGPDSLIGETTAAAGPGERPFWVKGGRVYLTGPYKGAPFGLSIVVPAVAGPFNLGNVIVRAAVSVDRFTAQITVKSDPLPTILQGFPLDIRTVNVTVNRPGFMFNPTNCSPLSVTGAIGSTSGASAGVSSPFQAANCQGLPFKPSLKVSTQARTSKASGASLLFKIASGAGQVNIGKVRLVFPRQLPARLTTLQKACTEAVFNANPAGCPAGSVIGTAVARTPVLASVLTGPIYLVSHGGAAFPDAVIVLQGEGIVLHLVGNTNIKKGITSSTFNSVPDAPISTFEARLPEGSHSAFATNIAAKAKGNMCGQSLTLPTTLTGQNGAVVKQATRITVTGCSKVKKKIKHGKKARRHADRRGRSKK